MVRGSEVKSQTWAGLASVLALYKLGDPGPVPSPPKSGISYMKLQLRASQSGPPFWRPVCPKGVSASASL